MEGGAREYRLAVSDPDALVRRVAGDFASESIDRGLRVDLDVATSVTA